MSRTDGNTDDVMVPVGGDVGDEVASGAPDFAEMMAAGNTDDGDADGATKADATPVPDPEPAPDAKALSEDDEAYLRFGRDVASGFDEDPVGTIERLIQTAAQRDPGIARKVAAVVAPPAAEGAKAPEGLPEDFEPLDELGTMLAPHAAELTRLPAEVKSTTELLGRVSVAADHMAVQLRTQEAINAAVMKAMGLAPLPAIDVASVIDDVMKGGKSYDDAFASRVGTVLSKWGEGAVQKAAVRPDTPRASTRAPVGGNGSFADLWSAAEGDVDAVRARSIVRDGAMRPIGAKR